MHKRITFASGTLGRFIKKHGITFRYLQVPPEMICRRQDHPGEKHFILNLAKRGGGTIRIPFSQGAGISTWPDLEETLERLAADVLMYHDTPDPKGFVMTWGSDIEDWEQEFEIVKALTKATQEFLGEKAFNELIEMAHRGFEMEGDRGWRRQQTCGW